MDEEGGYWLSRLKVGTVVRDPRRRAIAWSSRPPPGRAVTPGQTLGSEALLGIEARVSARLLAERVPQEAANERRRRLRVEAKRRRRGVPSETQLAFADWTILITNAPPELLLEAREAFVVMRARWQIEKLFDLWKRYGHLDKSRGGKPWRVMCEVYAKLLGLVIQQWVLLSSPAFWSRPYRTAWSRGGGRSGGERSRWPMPWRIHRGSPRSWG